MRDLRGTRREETKWGATEKKLEGEGLNWEGLNGERLDGEGLKRD